MITPLIEELDTPRFDHAGLRHAFGRLLKRAAALVILIALVAGSWLGWKIYHDAAKLTGDKNPLQLLSAFTPAALKQTDGRTNILLAGYSADDAGHQGADLTDSIMILSINQADKSAVVISVPRDLYVDIPGYGYSKINAAYEYGQSENFSAAGYPDGGMGLLEQTLTQDFGVQFNYYSLINYSAFEDAVNAVGGVTVNIQSSDPRGLYDPNTGLDLPNGTVTLNGQQALNLARARGDGYGSYGFPEGDFNRTQDQQLLLVALKDKLSGSGLVPGVLKASNLADSIGNNVTTDMKIDEMETLYSATRDITDANIESVSLNNLNGTDLLGSYTTDSGQDALIPVAGFDDFSQIQTALQGLLAGNQGS